MLQRALRVVFLCLILLNVSTLFAQFHDGTNMQFGQQRVQYRNFTWLYYPGDFFQVYYYEGGRDLAGYAFGSLQGQLEAVEDLFKANLDGPVQVLIFNKHADFRQSNIGISTAQESNIGGTTRIEGGRLFVWFDGDHASFNRQLSAGLHRLMIRQLLYGSDWKEWVKNASLLSLPDWYEDGLVAALSKAWDPGLEARLADLILRGKLPVVGLLEGDEAVEAGRSLWDYIIDTYGRAVIPQVLNAVRSGRSVEAGFRMLGLDAAQLLSSAQLYQFQSLGLEPTLALKLGAGSVQDRPDRKTRRRMGEVPARSKKQLNYTALRPSPDGRFAVSVSDQRGQASLWLHDINSGSTRRIARYDHKLPRIVDPTWPVLAWHPSAPMLASIHEEKGRVWLTTTNVETGDQTERELFRIEKVIALDFSPDGHDIVFSGVRNGVSDLYLYRILAASQSPLFNDSFDDLHPRFTPDGQSLVFSSNRPSVPNRASAPARGRVSTPAQTHHDLYLYSLESGDIERLTDTPEIDERQPQALGGQRFVFQRPDDPTSLHLASIDSVIQSVDTTVHYRQFTRIERVVDWDLPPLDCQMLSPTQWGGLFLEDGRPKWRTGVLTDPSLASDPNSPQQQGQADLRANERHEAPPVFSSDLRPYQVDINRYVFESERDSQREQERAPAPSAQVGDGASTAAVRNPDPSQTPRVTLPKPRNYHLNYAVDQILSQVDNTFSTSFYQPISDPASASPGLGGLLKIGVSDVFEDRRWVGGVRLAGSLENSTFALSFQDLTERVDRQWIIERQGYESLIDGGDGIIRVHTHALHHRRTYPFSEVASMRFTATYRLDRTAYLATDPFNLSRDNLYQNGLGGDIALVYDNTYSRGLNLPNGTRAKAWIEYLAEPGSKGQAFSTLGFDARHYEALHKRMTLAFRAAASTNLGSRQLLHYLGGVDRALIPLVNQDLAIPKGEFVYQTNATPMRGFYRNTRSGSSFALLSAELRWPPFTTFFQPTTLNPLLENFQIVGFSDIGAAWTGADPYNEDNEFNHVTVSQNPVTVTVNNNREPIIWDFGFGLRGQFLGYFVRADWGWGVDDGLLLDRVFQLSLTTDF